MQKHVTNTRDMGKNGPRVFPRAHDPFCHLVKIPSLETRGDYSAPRDLECVSNRLARSTRDPGTSLAANTYRYIIIRDRLPPYRYTPHFSHGARWTLERNRRFIVLSRRGRELSRSERNAWSSLLRVHLSREKRSGTLFRGKSSLLRWTRSEPLCDANFSNATELFAAEWNIRGNRIFRIEL